MGGTEDEVRRQITAMSGQLKALRCSELARLENRLHEMRRCLHVLPERKAKPWSVFRLLRCTSDERTHSNVLAYLLDPGCPHGLGPLFLNQFLERAGIDSNAMDTRSAGVDTEVWIGSRIADIVVEMDLSVVVVENKVYSAESPSQTVDLEREVSSDKRYAQKERRFVFLTPDGRPATSPSFVPVSYRGIAEMIRSLPFGTMTGVPSKTSALLADMLDHIEEEFGMAQETWSLTERSKLYLEFRDEIKELTKAYDDDVWQLARLVEGLARRALPEGNWTYGAPKGGYQQMYKKHWWKQHEYYVHYELWLTGDALAKREVSFMLDVENARSEEILGLFDEDPKIAQQVRARGSEYRPDHRRSAVAFRTYTFAEDLSDVQAILARAFEEHAYLARKVDEVLASLK